MRWKNNAIEGFEIFSEDDLVMVVRDRNDLISIAEVCLEGALECSDDDGELVLVCEDSGLLLRLARDLLIAATASHFDLQPSIH